jgi:hypothetical protein
MLENRTDSALEQVAAIDGRFTMAMASVVRLRFLTAAFVAEPSTVNAEALQASGEGLGALLRQIRSSGRPGLQHDVEYRTLPAMRAARRALENAKRCGFADRPVSDNERRPD